MEELFEKWNGNRRRWLKRLFAEGVRHYSINDPDMLLGHVIHQIELHSKSREGISDTEELLKIIDSIKEENENFRMYCDGIIERENYFTGTLKFAKMDPKKPEHRASLAIMNYILAELPNLPHHKPTTKAYQTSFNLFVDMLKGSFVTKRSSLKKFIEDRKLSADLLIKKPFKISEIKDALKMLDDKVARGRLKNRSLPEFLFDNHGMYGTNSPFLVAWNDTKKISVIK